MSKTESENAKRAAYALGGCVGGANILVVCVLFVRFVVGSSKRMRAG